MNQIIKQTSNQSFLTFFGSDGVSPVEQHIHTDIFKAIHKDNLQIALLTTPSGFEPHVQVIYEMIRSIFMKAFTVFNPDIKIIFSNTRDDANNPEIVKEVDSADYIFIGHGSPTYTVAHLSETLLFNRLKKRLHEGASLSLSADAAIAFSRYCLPVFEIYKVGSIPYWEKGLDFYTSVYKPLTIIPRLNHQDNDSSIDTSHSFIGQKRFNQLLTKLPKSEKVIGINEDSALCINLTLSEQNVLGKGKIHMVQ